jgi:hypothetical protein
MAKSRAGANVPPGVRTSVREDAPDRTLVDEIRGDTTEHDEEHLRMLRPFGAAD